MTVKQTAEKVIAEWLDGIDLLQAERLSLPDVLERALREAIADERRACAHLALNVGREYGFDAQGCVCEHIHARQTE